MSWLTPVVREIMADGAATSHKLQFFENGATPNMVVSFDPEIQQEQIEEFKKIFDARRQGHGARVRDAVLGGGADVKVVGADMKQVDFKVDAGRRRDEDRRGRRRPADHRRPVRGPRSGDVLQLRAGAPPVRRRHHAPAVAQRRRQPLATLITSPPARSSGTTTATSRSCRRTSRTPRTSSRRRRDDPHAHRGRLRPGHGRRAVTAGDLNRLGGAHTGLVSVQLQPPGSGSVGVTPAANAANGRRSLLAAHLTGQ
jgi:hypothetical protein